MKNLFAHSLPTRSTTTSTLFPHMTHNLLLVDPDRFVAHVLRHTLGPEFKISTLPNGLEAMNWLEAGNHPDVIITELDLPYVDGYEFIQLVRSSSLLRHLPIIVLSAEDDSTTRVSCLERGADGYLSKPFNPYEIRAKAKAILRRMHLVPAYS
jgi:DNA-binding response OmpR family regulator